MSVSAKKKELKTVPVSFTEFTDPDFIPYGSYYIRNAMGEYLFIKTSDRKAAQEHVDEYYGKGRYTVIPSKTEKLKSRLESGGLSCTGTATRRGQQKR